MANKEIMVERAGLHVYAGPNDIPVNGLGIPYLVNGLSRLLHLPEYINTNPQERQIWHEDDKLWIYLNGIRWQIGVSMPVVSSSSSSLIWSSSSSSLIWSSSSSQESSSSSRHPESSSSSQRPESSSSSQSPEPSSSSQQPAPSSSSQSPEPSSSSQQPEPSSSSQQPEPSSSSQQPAPSSSSQHPEPSSSSQHQEPSSSSYQPESSSSSQHPESSSSSQQPEPSSSYSSIFSSLSSLQSFVSSSSSSSLVPWEEMEAELVLLLSPDMAIPLGNTALLADVGDLALLLTADGSSSSSVSPPARIPTLMLHFTSKEGGTVVTDNSDYQQSVTAYNGAQIIQTDGKFGPCIDLDGSNDYLRITCDDTFRFGLFDFTISGWFKFDTYPDVVGGSHDRMYLFSLEDTNGYFQAVGLYLVAPYSPNSSYTRLMGSVKGKDGVMVYVGSAYLSAGSWHHFEFNRHKTTVRLALDGTMNTATDPLTSPEIYEAYDYFYIGRAPWYEIGGKLSYLDGKIDDLQIFPNEVLHDSNFTVPASPAEPNALNNDSYTQLLLPFDDDFNDIAYALRSPTVVGSPTRDTNYKFGTHSLKCDAYTNRLEFDDSPDWYLGTGDFTIDFWFRTDNAGSVRYVCAQDDSTYSFMVGVKTSGSSLGLEMRAYNGSTTVFQYTTNTVSGTAGNWNHFALVRADGAMFGFLNGSLLTTNSYISGSIPNVAAKLVVGAGRVAHYESMWSMIDEFRWSKGIARWTTAFSVPTAAYAKPSY